MEDRGNYLYVEQALSTMQNKPYRQRIYKVTSLDNGDISSEIFKIENDSLWIGKWKMPDSFDVLSEADLLEREGCAVTMKRVSENYFKGSTNEKSCISSMRGG